MLFVLPDVVDFNGHLREAQLKSSTTSVVTLGDYRPLTDLRAG